MLLHEMYHTFNHYVVKVHFLFFSFFVYEKSKTPYTIKDFTSNPSDWEG